ncbi:hypothetical protein M2F94_20585 [Vibrio vulnificus]|nr:hypothetical protein [Vibrio vulnificus]
MYNFGNTPLNAEVGYLDWLGKDKVRLLETLDSWDMNPVEQKLIQSGHSTASNVKNHILWYKQFMSFKVIRPNIPCGMFSDIINGVWHQHILFTEDYAKFSDALLGKFIHHIPCNIMDMSPEALDEYGIWISDYEQVYGHLPEDLAEELKNNPKGDKCNNHVHADENTYKCR